MISLGRDRRHAFWQTFWHVVDTGGIVCQLVFYPYFVAAGMLMMFTGAPSTVFRALGPHTETVWVLTLVTAPLAVLVGSKVPNRFLGISIELGANVTLMGSLMCYAVAITQAAWLDNGAFSPWLALGAAEMVLFICLRDARRLMRSEKRARRENIE